MDDEDKALLLLNAIPKSYEHFKDAMLYGRKQTIFIEEIQLAIRAKELQKTLDRKEGNNGDGLVAKSRTEKLDSKGNKKSRSKFAKGGNGQSTKGPFNCFQCHKEGHFKRDCLERKKRNQEKKRDGGNAIVASEVYDFADALVVIRYETSKERILDSSCSFNICPHKDWFESLDIVDGSLVLLGNNKACKITRIGSIRITMHDGIERLLQHVRYIPELKRI